MSTKWKWIASIVAVLVLGILVYSINTTASITDFAQAYNDQQLFNNALEKANQNDEVKTSFGQLQPIDKLAILEGNVVYQNDGNTVVATIRISGSTSKGKMDIEAHKTGEVWHYDKITLRNPALASAIEVEGAILK
ncbi:MAG: hypothetical protein IR153_04865 [Flavobacterium sp.]|nr:hypothetical protein [Flavobacterium sp.]